MSARLFFVVLVMLATLIAPREALAQAPPTNPSGLPARQANFVWESQPKGGPDQLFASFSFVDVVDSALRNKLSSGLPTVVVMRAYLLREGEAEPIALAARTCRVVYDLWDDAYRLQMSGPGGVQNTATPTVAGVLRNCFETRKMLIAERPQITGNKPHLLAVIVEVNPVNAQMVEQMRKWVTRPAGSTGIGPGDALFGSFVGLFVKDIGKADRTLQFRTQAVP